MKLRHRTQLFVRDPETDARSPSSVRGGKKPHYTVLRRNAREVMNFRVWRKLLLIFVGISVALLLIFYSFTLIYDRTGRFSVSVQSPDEIFAISLCENKEFSTKSSRLVTNQEVQLTNICGDNLPKNIDNVDGDHSSENYLAYTYYCKNVGNADCSLNYELTFNNVSNGIDECVRVRLYINGEYLDYAKTRSDGNGDETHYCDRPFAGKYVVCRGTCNSVAIDELTKFTIVVWLEGDDADCNDSVMYGKIKFDMTIEAKPVVE